MKIIVDVNNIQREEFNGNSKEAALWLKRKWVKMLFENYENKSLDSITITTDKNYNKKENQVDKKVMRRRLCSIIYSLYILKKLFNNDVTIEQYIDDIVYSLEFDIKRKL